MNIHIKATNITLTPEVNEYVSKRFQSIEKLLQNDPTVKVDIEIGKTTEHHKNGDIFRAEVHIVGKHRDIYVTAERNDLYMAIDEVRDATHTKVTAGKEKRLAFVRKGGAKVKNIIKQFFGKSEE